MDLTTVTNIASKIGVVTLLLLIIVGGQMGYWVYGTTYKEVAADRDDWKRLALQGAKVSVVTMNHHIAMLKYPGMPSNSALTPPNASSTKSDIAKILKQVESKQQPFSEPTDLPL